MRNTIKVCLAVAMLALLPALAANASIPIAHCRAGDKTESGLQGLTTPAEIASGAATTTGFNCNVDNVGQYQGEGASWQLTAWKNCAYFDQRRTATEAHPGTVVVDVTDPAHPTPTAWLTEPGMIDPWESLKVNTQRQLLAAAQQGGPGLAIYDISGDCKQPVLKSSPNLPGSIGHTGQWAPDGKTYYITPLRPTPSIVVVDTSDVTNPVIIPCATGSFGCNGQGFFVNPAPLSPVFHDLEFSPDGNTAYVATTGTPNGLVILDVSDFQSRKPSPAFRIVGSLGWDDGSRGAQNALYMKVKGKPYILFSDESGGGATACTQGKSGAGFPRIIDISDPTKPFTVSKLILDIHDPVNCTTAVNTPVANANSSSPFGFSCHYCNVDDIDNAKIAACECFASGLRLFDISDVTYPREIGYLKPPGQKTKPLPASQYANSAGTFTRNFDWATSKPSFPKDRGMTTGDLWTTFQDNGFMVVKISPNATASAGGCASVDASVGGMILLGLVQMLRRRRNRAV